MKLVAQHLAHKSDDCTFELDEYRNDAGEQMLLAHLRVHRWTKESMLNIKREWKLFRQCVTAPLFANPPQDNPKWVKFVTLMGWRPFSKVLCHDGIERPLYIHTV